MLKYLKHRTDVGTARTGKQRMENNLLATFWAHCGRPTTSSSVPKSTSFGFTISASKKKDQNPFTHPCQFLALLFAVFVATVAPKSKPKQVDGLQPKGGSFNRSPPPPPPPPLGCCGCGQWEVEDVAAARLGFCLAICRISMATPQSNPSQPLYLRPKWFVCPRGIGKYV